MDDITRKITMGDGVQRFLQGSRNIARKVKVILNVQKMVQVVRRARSVTRDDLRMLYDIHNDSVCIGESSDQVSTMWRSRTASG